MSVIYVCDSCGAQSDDDVKVYEVSDEVLQNLVNNAKYIFSLIAQRDRLNSNIANLKADVEKAGYEIGEDENGKFLARKLKRKVDKIYL